MQLNTSLRISARILSSFNAANRIAPRQNSHCNSKVIAAQFQLPLSMRIQHVVYRVAMQLLLGLHLDKIRTGTRRLKCSSISAAFEPANFSPYFIEFAMQLIFGLHLDNIRTETRRFKCSSSSAAFEPANFIARILSSCNATNIWIACRQYSH